MSQALCKGNDGCVSEDFKRTMARFMDACQVSVLYSPGQRAAAFVFVFVLEAVGHN